MMLLGKDDRSWEATQVAVSTFLLPVFGDIDNSAYVYLGFVLNSFLRPLVWMWVLVAVTVKTGLWQI